LDPRPTRIYRTIAYIKRRERERWREKKDIEEMKEEKERCGKRERSGLPD
jgi:hypothetical protein